MIFEPMDRIVFAGDSVTDMGSAQPVGEGLFDNVGQSYVRIIENMLSTWYPEVYLRVIQFRCFRQHEQRSAAAF